MKKRFLILAAALLICGCGDRGLNAEHTNISNVSHVSAKSAQDQGEPYTKHLFAMDTYMGITAYGDKGAEALEAAVQEIELLEGLLSVTDENSEIHKANFANQWDGAVSQPTADIVSKSLDICRRTEGAVDISIYPVIQVWGFTTGHFNVPDENTLNDLLHLVDYEKIQAEGGSLTVPDGMMVDLGAFAKGYCGDRIKSIMEGYGVESALLSLGGNIHAIGSKPDGSPWRVAIQDPKDSQSVLGVIEVRDKAVVTSGGYERYFEEDGQIYWHIMSPETGRPADNGIISVTVVSESGVLCDGLSTALFVMGKDKALDHYEKYGDFEAVIIMEDNEIIVTPGLKSQFSIF